jgi:hypothetical protein
VATGSGVGLGLGLGDWLAVGPAVGDGDAVGEVVGGSVGIAVGETVGVNVGVSVEEGTVLGVCSFSNMAKLTAPPTIAAVASTPINMAGFKFDLMLMYLYLLFFVVKHLILCYRKTLDISLYAANIEQQSTTFNNRMAENLRFGEEGFTNS